MSTSLPVLRVPSAVKATRFASGREVLQAVVSGLQALLREAETTGVAGNNLPVVSGASNRVSEQTRAIERPRRAVD